MLLKKIKRPWSSASTKKDDPFYLSTHWRKKREIIILRDKGLCQYSLKQGILTPGNIVDHILPRRLYPELELEDNNLCCCSELMHQKKRRVERECSNRFDVKVKLKQAGFI